MLFFCGLHVRQTPHWNNGILQFLPWNLTAQSFPLCLLHLQGCHSFAEHKVSCGKQLGLWVYPLGSIWISSQLLSHWCRQNFHWILLLDVARFCLYCTRLLDWGTQCGSSTLHSSVGAPASKVSILEWVLGHSVSLLCFSYWSWFCFFSFFLSCLGSVQSVLPWCLSLFTNLFATWCDLGHQGQSIHLICHLSIP